MTFLDLAEVNVHALASVVLSIVRGMSMQWLLDGASLDLTAIKGEVRRLFERAFAGSEKRSRSIRCCKANG
jgi:hypothetical protein